MPRWEQGSADRLTKAALELFEEQGFEDTSVVEIADRARVTTARSSGTSRTTRGVVRRVGSHPHGARAGDPRCPRGHGAAPGGHQRPDGVRLDRPRQGAPAPASRCDRGQPGTAGTRADQAERHRDRGHPRPATARRRGGCGPTRDAHRSAGVRHCVRPMGRGGRRRRPGRTHRRRDGPPPDPPAGRSVGAVPGGRPRSRARYLP